VRVVALDLGSRRIGVAVSDPSGTIASPHSVIERTGEDDVDHQAINDVVVELEAERVVVGLPVSMGGAMGPAARAAAAEAQALATVLAVPVETFDERLTTVAADRLLLAGRVRGGARRRVVDKIAAAVILQGWLEKSGRERG
jgi:putative Holliday junction resolvase